MSRFLGSLLFIAFCLLMASDCQAQRHRRWFRNGRRPVETRHHHDQVNTGAVTSSHGYPMKQRYQDARASKAARALRDYDAADPFPKYIGGFHASHFYNLGVPTGDLGFRGNGLYWAPW